jgi:GT2 family glycosyltransferase
LPPRDAAPGIFEVEGVTGALMLMSRKLFDEIGGFSPSYLRGDFEDGDLCLKVRQAGMRVGIVRQCPAYHLERQSIRKAGTGGARAAITYVNCVHFNDTWFSEARAPALSG